MSEELKPCPFCGCKNITIERTHEDRQTYIKCENGGCLFFVGILESVEDAKTMWNKRAYVDLLTRNLKRQQKEIDRLRKLVNE